MASTTAGMGLALVLAFGLPLPAQPVPAASQPVYSRLSALLGTTVRASDAPAGVTAEAGRRRDDEKRDDERDGERGGAVRAEVAPTTWKVVDLLFVRGQGRVQAVVLEPLLEPLLDPGASPRDEAAARRIAVPPARLDPNKARIELPSVTLARLARFSLTGADATTLAVRVARAQSNWAELHIDDAQPAVPATDAAAAATVEVAAASKLAGRTVHALDVPFGTIDRVIVDWSSQVQALAFAVLTRQMSESGATQRYLVPWSALAWSEHGSEVRAALSLSGDQIEEGDVGYDEAGGLVDPRLAQRARALFGGHGGGQEKSDVDRSR